MVPIFIKLDYKLLKLSDIFERKTKREWQWGQRSAEGRGQ